MYASPCSYFEFFLSCNFDDEEEGEAFSVQTTSALLIFQDCFHKYMK